MAESVSITYGNYDYDFRAAGGSCPEITYSLEDDSSGAAKMRDGVIYYSPDFATDELIELDVTAVYEDILQLDISEPLEIGSEVLSFQI